MTLNPMFYFRAAKDRAVATYEAAKAKAAELAQSERAQSLKATVANAADKVNPMHLVRAAKAKAVALVQGETAQSTIATVAKYADKVNPMHLVRAVKAKVASMAETFTSTVSAVAATINPMRLVRFVLAKIRGNDTTETAPTLPANNQPAVNEGQVELEEEENTLPPLPASPVLFIGPQAEGETVGEYLPFVVAEEEDADANLENASRASTPTL